VAKDAGGERQLLISFLSGLNEGDVVRVKAGMGDGTGLLHARGLKLRLPEGERHTAPSVASERL
jgi:hypothetical protein